MRNPLSTVLALAISAVFLSAPSASAQDKDAAAKKKEAMEKLSKALEKFAEPERRKRSDQMKSVLADIDRAAKLSDGQKKEFDLAVKGAVERSLDTWRQNYQRYAESRFQSNPGDINEVIQRLGRVSFGTQAKEAPQRQAIWHASIERILTPEQNDEYEKVIAQRTAFQREAVARSLVAHVDAKCSLTNEQRDKALKVVMPVVEKHFEGLTEIYGGEMRNLYYQLGIFLNGVDKNSTKDFLSEEQQRGWDEIAGQHSSMWESVKQRTQQIEAQKKEREAELKRIREAARKKEEAKDGDAVEGAAGQEKPADPGKPEGAADAPGQPGEAPGEAPGKGAVPDGPQPPAVAPPVLAPAPG